MAYAGSCLCGSATYRSDAAPVFQGNCYCKDCQKESGAGHITAVAVTDDGFEANGPLSVYNKPTDSGGTLETHFCPTCGTTLFTRPSNAPGMTLMRAGTLDHGDVVPQMNLYAPSAPAWDPASAELPGFSGMPPRG